jgi:hypothetical protein
MSSSWGRGMRILSTTLTTSLALLKTFWYSAYVKLTIPIWDTFLYLFSVIRGNVKLIETVLKTKKVDFYQLLGNQLFQMLKNGLISSFFVLLGPW